MVISDPSVMSSFPSLVEAFASLRHLRVRETERRHPEMRHPRVNAIAFIREVRVLASLEG